MAEQYVERSDHILFLLTDDKATADELNRFGLIQTQGKGLTVLLNIKAADDDLDLLLDEPGYIFKDDEIEGHTRRICGYLTHHFSMSPPHLIPIHARAAWLSRRAASLPPGIADRSLLHTRSRFPILEARIIHFIKDEALQTRILAPRHLLRSAILPFQEQLKQEYLAFKQISDQMEKLHSQIIKSTKRIEKRLSQQLMHLRRQFQVINDAIPQMVDTSISAGERGELLNDRWKILLQRNKLDTVGHVFMEAAEKIFAEEMKAELDIARFDHDFNNAMSIDSHLDEYYKVKNSKNDAKLARNATRVAVAAASIANIWNPIGWFGLASLFVLPVGELIANSYIKDFEKNSIKQLQQHRTEIIQKLRTSLWADHEKLKEKCWTIVTNKIKEYIKYSDLLIEYVKNSADNIQKISSISQNNMNDIIQKINIGLLRHALTTFIPEIRTGVVQINTIINHPGRYAKIEIFAPSDWMNSTTDTQSDVYLALQRVQAIMGDERICLVDTHASLETRIVQALGLPSDESKNVFLFFNQNQTKARVRLNNAPGSWGAAARDPLNLHLASQLLDIAIDITEL